MIMPAQSVGSIWLQALEEAGDGTGLLQAYNRAAPEPNTKSFDVGEQFAKQPIGIFELDPPINATCDLKLYAQAVNDSTGLQKIEGVVSVPVPQSNQIRFLANVNHTARIWTITSHDSACDLSKLHLTLWRVPGSSLTITITITTVTVLSITTTILSPTVIILTILTMTTILTVTITVTVTVTLSLATITLLSVWCPHLVMMFR